ALVFQPVALPRAQGLRTPKLGMAPVLPESHASVPLRCSGAYLLPSKTAKCPAPVVAEAGHRKWPLPQPRGTLHLPRSQGKPLWLRSLRPSVSAMDYAPVRWSALISPATLLVLILFAALLIGIGVVWRRAWRRGRQK